MERSLIAILRIILLPVWLFCILVWAVAVVLSAILIFALDPSNSGHRQSARFRPLPRLWSFRGNRHSRVPPG
jgi:hypothetical protein